MKSRVLPVTEWHRLAGTLIDPATLPNDAVPVVVEQDGAIIGCSVLLPIWHQEGTWLAPAYRGNVAAGRRLVEAMRTQLSHLGIDGLWMTAFDDENARLIEKFGTAAKVDAAHYLVTMR
jgi:hypothetical protein